ncbi:MAG: 2-amino-4-hydroxy-6-hydroxymethyldihydropteridine diphosphokinase [bacterium]|nr:2-amino-4-hydroxy-6-hydroxymethyldihydropteridine diphosphokinase [bacterium]
MINCVYVAFGTNVGDRVKNFGDVMKEFGVRGIHMKRIAGLYASSPMDGVQGLMFLNTVIECNTDLTPRKFLEQLQRIENALGSPTVKNGAERTCDLDIVLFKQQTISLPDLEIPHPRLIERDFVLKPLCDLIPDEYLPGTTLTFAELLERCELNSIVHTVVRKAK